MAQEKIIYKPEFGTDLKVAAWNAILEARKNNQEIVFDYNGVQINVDKNTGVRYIVNAFFSQAASMPNMAMQKEQNDR